MVKDKPNHLQEAFSVAKGFRVALPIHSYALLETLRVTDSQQLILDSAYKNSDYVCLRKSTRFLTAALSQIGRNVELGTPLSRNAKCSF